MQLMNLEFWVLLFAVVGGVQSFFFILFISGFSYYKFSHKANHSPVSVIIAARNELNNLPTLIEHLSKQTHPNFEIVIVNDRSNDGTFDYLAEQCELHHNLKVVTVKHKPDQMDGKKYALTLGIKAAKHEVLVFTDADCEILSDSWLEGMVAQFENATTQITLGVSLYKRSKGLLSSFIQFESLWTAIQYIGFGLLGMPYMGVGRNLAYRKELFLSSKGFNDIISVTGGDDDLFVNKHATRKNTNIKLGKDYLTLSISKNSWKEFLTQKLRHISVGSRYKFRHKFILGLLTLSQLLFWSLLIFNLFLLKDPTVIVTIFLIRTLLLYLTFIIASKKIGTGFNLWGLVFLDFIFAFYYLSTGVRAIFTKRVRWI